MGSESGTPTVSVVIGAYNAAPWLEQTLNSVLAQTYRPFEVVVVDDGSTDETPDLVARYGGAFRYVRKENGGAASARNMGVRLAQGRYIAFLDHDDLWVPQKLERQMLLFEQDPDLGWSYTDALFFQSETGKALHRVGQTNKLHDGNVLRPLLLGNFVPPGTTVVKRSVFEDVGFFEESEAYRHVDDWDMWLRVAERYPVRYVDEPLTYYRVHAVQASQTMNLEEALANRLHTVDAAIRRAPGSLADVRARAEASAYFTIGRKQLDRERRSAARKLLCRTIRLHPAKTDAYLYLCASLVPRHILLELGKVRQIARGTS